MKLKLKNSNNIEDSKDIYENVKKELEDDFKPEIEYESINVEISQEDLIKTNKKYKKLLIKKLILYIAIILTMLSIISFGAYKTFFEHKYTGEEIAFLANRYNNKTNFPENGVQGYLESNIDKLLKDKLNIDSKVTKLSISKPVVTKINNKNDSLSNIYFYTTIISNVGQTKVNCILPIYWDENKQEYNPAGQIIFTPNNPSNSNTQEKKNDLLSFDDIEKEQNENIESSKIFLNNFFTMLYSGQDITPYYKGQTNLHVEDLKYDGMNEYMLYKDTNGNGYNATLKINLIMNNGISYTTQKYITIEKSGESWIVKAVL